MRYQKIGEWEYVGLEALTIGDYGGGGTVGVANQRVVDAAIAAGDATSAGTFSGPGSCWSWDRGDTDGVEGEDVVMVAWAYGGCGYLIRCDDGASEWARGIVAALADYPLLDEGEWTSVERDWEEEALPDVLWDLRRLFSEDGRDAWDGMHSHEQLELFRDACEETNTYWEHEHASAWIDVKRLVKAPCLAPFLAVAESE